MPNKSPHRATGLVAENLQLPAQFKRPDCSMETIMLDAQVIRPDDDLPHPLVVFNHTYSSDPTKIYVDFMRLATVEYARRGLVTLAFTRRGNGLSEGQLVQGINHCTQEEIARFDDENIQDILEAIRLISLKPYVDKNKIVNVGGNTGGFLAVALTTYAPSGLVASVSMAGTIVPRSGSKKCSDKELITAMSKIGRVSRVPTLWIYRSNSPRITQKAGRDMAYAFVENGGNAEFVPIPPVGFFDGFPFESGVSTWSKYIDPFLRKVGIQTLDDPIPSNRIRVIYGSHKTN